MDAGRPAIIVPAGAMHWRWCRGYVGNIADAIALVATDNRAVGRTYHVADPRALTQTEWVRTIGRIAGWTGEVVAIPDDLLPAHLRAEQLRPGPRRR